MPSHPRLRSLDIRPTHHGGAPALLVRDPLELADRYLILPHGLGPALFLLDGEHALADLPDLLAEAWGVRVGPEVLAELLAALDEALFLDNDRSQEALAAALARYRADAFRSPGGAGQSYPAQPQALRSLLDGYLAGVKGDAILPAGGGGPNGAHGLLSPHIDYERGGRVYAQVWRQGAEMAQAARRVVILGTDHYAGHNRVTLTRQNYATPYGLLPTDQEVVAALAAAIGPEQAFAGELYHRREHSLELVLTWLHHMRGGRPVAVTPILTGSFHPFIANGGHPAADPAFAALLHTLAPLARDPDTLFLASGDLAHVGPAFGGEPVGIIERAEVRAHDDELRAHLAAGDAEGFWAFIKAGEDAKNVCGVSPFYLTLKLLAASEGHPAGYALCPADPQNTSIVSVCGMVFG